MHRFSQYIAESQLDQLVALYAPDALFVPQPGVEHRGPVVLDASSDLCNPLDFNRFEGCGAQVPQDVGWSGRHPAGHTPAGVSAA